MEYFVQQLINGLTLGSIYGLIAIGYTMVYGIIGMINFAHGDVFMVGAFIALIAFLALTAIGVTAIPLALLVVLIIAIGLTLFWPAYLGALPWVGSKSAALVPIEPDAPGWVTTTTSVPSASSRIGATTRVTWSVEPPADHGTMILIGRSGSHVWAETAPEAMTANAAVETASFKKVVCIGSSLDDQMVG